MTCKNIKILDCTLRDGGYINNWMFGKENIQLIMSNLEKAKVDFIECGFLKECNYNEDKTFYPKIEDFLGFTNPNQNYTLMVNFGEYNISNYEICNNPNLKIRVAFKKHQQDDALDYIQQLKKKGWDVFVNPMITNTYDKNELLFLIEKLNIIKPFCLSIVDTLGNMDERDVVDIFEFIDKSLDLDIKLAFHSHNSMQLSFSNTKSLLNMNIKRQLIIDSCIYGMGRGAGNLCTELITKYLNDNFQADYDISPILETIEKSLTPIYQKTSWGYSTPFYIAAIRGCHPNYAQTLLNEGLTDAQIDAILQKIPEEKRKVFDKSQIESLLK